MNDEPENSGEELELVPDEEGGLPDLQAKIKKLKAELVRSEKERKEYLDGWQRAKADLINYKKEEGRRFEELARFAGTSLIEEILPVLDSFDLALAGNSDKGMERGIMLIRSQLEDVVRKRGIAVIQVQPGDIFNPEKHESIGEVESDKPAGSIAEAVQRGYELSGRVIRPARVRLVKESSTNFGKGAAVVALLALEMYHVILPLATREYPNDMPSISLPKIGYHLPPDGVDGSEPLQYPRYVMSGYDTSAFSVMVYDDVGITEQINREVSA